MNTQNFCRVYFKSQLLFHSKFFGGGTHWSEIRLKGKKIDTVLVGALFSYVGKTFFIVIFLNASHIGNLLSCPVGII